MPELLLELFSEEIPARMQARAAEELARLVVAALAPLGPQDVRSYAGPRRIALACAVAAGTEAARVAERGPRVAAPEQALAGFLRKRGAAREELRQEGEFWVLERTTPGVDAATLVARELPPLLRRFPWPKSMRWGGTSAFTWVRPLRRILCVLGGEVVRFDLRDGEDDGHGLVAGDLTEGHRFMAPGAFAVRSAEQWQRELRERYVIADAAERRAWIAERLREAAANRDYTLVEDEGLLDEVTGLAEWPVVLLGRIDMRFMDLPPEVMQVSMRVNQRYFALRDGAGAVAPWFAFVANIEARDGGAAIVAGNERVLRARFADARHFWDLDRKQSLASRVPALDAVTFHAKLGSQGDRVRRISWLATELAPLCGVYGDGIRRAERASKLAKADLVTGMVGEFPELQGVMGRYYAQHDNEPDEVADAIRDHYAPRGASDAVPTAPVSIVVALADRIDMLASFFVIGERPTGSGDPFALRRAALGLIRIVKENRVSLRLAFGVAAAVQLAKMSVAKLQQAQVERVQQELESLTGQPALGRQGLKTPGWVPSPETKQIFEFLGDRLRVQLRAEGYRHDVVDAVIGHGLDDDILRVLARVQAVADLLGTVDGANLLAGYKRAANILRIEEKRDGPHEGEIDDTLLEAPEERALADALVRLRPEIAHLLRVEDFAGAMELLAALRPPLDAFFDRVTVNDARPEYRRNRLRLLAAVRAAMHLAADFSRIEG